MENDLNPDMDENEIKISSNPVVRGLLIAAGTLSLGIGIIGIVVPLLPTTPFLLLAAACYSRSSRKFYLWLMTNRIFGNYIRNYQEGKGIPIQVKLTAVGFLWITIIISTFLVVRNYYVFFILAAIAVIVTFHILRLPTLTD